MKRTIPAAALSATLALTLCLAGPAHAEWYAGATAGQSKSKFNADNLAGQFLDFGYTTTQMQTDTRDNTYRVFGGYQLNKYLAFEGGYADLGEFGVRSTLAPAGTFDKRFAVKGYDVSAVGTWPVVDKLTLFARAGVFRSERKTRYAASGAVELLPSVIDSKQTQNKATYGAGLMFDLTNQITLRAELTQHRGFSDELLSGLRNIDAYGVGVVYRFR